VFSVRSARGDRTKMGTPQFDYWHAGLIGKFGEATPPCTRPVVVTVVAVAPAGASATYVGMGWPLASGFPCLQVRLGSLASVAPHGACADLLVKLHWFCTFRFAGLVL
jgi:hypothetical protein